MPRIQEYNTRTSVSGSVPQVRRASTENLDPVGELTKSIHNAGSVAGIMLQQAEQNDVSNLHVQFAKANQRAIIDLQEQSDHGTLDTDEYLSRRSDQLEEIRQEVSSPAGQRLFDQQSALMKSEWAISAIKAKRVLVGNKAVQDQITAADTMSNTLLKNPSGFESAVAVNRLALEEKVKTGLLPYEQMVKLDRQNTEQFAKDTMVGWAMLNPNHAKQILDSGAMDAYLGKGMKDQLYDEVKRQDTGQRIEQERIQKMNEKVIAEKQGVTQNEFLKKLNSNELSAHDVLNSNLEAFGSGSKEQFLQLVKHQNDDRIKTDSGTFLDVWNRIHSNGPDKITDENELNNLVGKGLTVQNVQMFRAEMQGKKSVEGGIENQLKENFINGVVKSQLDPRSSPMGLPDPDGKVRMQAYLSWFLPEFQKQKQAGKTAEELLTPGSKYYMGMQVPNYAPKDSQEVMRSIVRGFQPQGYQLPPNLPTPSGAPPQTIPQAAPTPGVAPSTAPSSAPSTKPRWEPGESADAYLKRIQGTK